MTSQRTLLGNAMARAADEPMAAPTIERHRTAITRTDLSRPVRLALEDGLITRETSVFDYGCGRGTDILHLQHREIACQGWDPAYFPDNERTPADIVNLGYVVNVIENPRERTDALRRAWALARKVLIVSARPQPGGGARYADPPH